MKKNKSGDLVSKVPVLKDQLVATKTRAYLHDKEWEKTGHYTFQCHPQIVLVPPHGIEQPFTKVALGPTSLLREPPKVRSWSLRQTKAARCVFRSIAHLEEAIGQMTIITECANIAEKLLI